MFQRTGNTKQGREGAAVPEESSDLPLSPKPTDQEEILILLLQTECQARVMGRTQPRSVPRFAGGFQ